MASHAEDRKFVLRVFEIHMRNNICTPKEIILGKHSQTCELILFRAGATRELWLKRILRGRLCLVLGCV